MSPLTSFVCVCLTQQIDDLEELVKRYQIAYAQQTLDLAVAQEEIRSANARISHLETRLVLVSDIAHTFAND